MVQRHKCLSNVLIILSLIIFSITYPHIDTHTHMANLLGPAFLLQGAMGPRGPAGPPGKNGEDVSSSDHLND